jgi:regulator of sirC expression with transglutaminase-like and TPR domain
MDFKLEVPTALEYFASLVQSDAHFPLLEAATSVAQDRYPELDIQQVLDEVDQWSSRLKKRLPADAGALHKLRLLNKFFFEELGFAGNLNDYYDPDNSCMQAVIRTRRGIPITLAVLWLELALGLGLHASGVGFPGHFLVKVRLPFPHEGQVVLDHG